MSERIFLEGVEVYAHGGVTEAERQIGQRYTVDISVEYNFSASSQSDRIDDTISYVILHDIAVSELKSSPFRLIESRAVAIADRVLAETPAESVTVQLRKSAPPIDGIVAAAGVEVLRRRL